jgi:aspartate kinase
MELIIQKYGGSSLASPQNIREAAQRIVRRSQQGVRLVVVVSAMGDTTDDLIELAHQVSARPDGRDLDLLVSTGEMVSAALLSMALKSLGQDAISLSGAQAGIQTDGYYSQAHILDINSQRMERELARSKVVVVAGFQGIERTSEDITTLGRGGSDTTAVALAARLKAKICEIYTDVEGIYTADPRVVPEARKLSEIDYEEMLELASYGSKVIHPRAVEIGKLYQIPILVAGSGSQSCGTLIWEGVNMEVKNKVRGVTFDMDVAKITIVGIPDEPGIATSLFEPLAQSNINVDTIVQNASAQGITDLTFSVSRGDTEKTLEVILPVTKSIKAQKVVHSTNLGKVSIVGVGMQNAPGYAARMFRTLYDAGVNIELITTSEIRITCIVEEDKIPAAIRSLHRAFELEKED